MYAIGNVDAARTKGQRHWGSYQFCSLLSSRNIACETDDNGPSTTALLRLVPRRTGRIRRRTFILQRKILPTPTHDPPHHIPNPIPYPLLLYTTFSIDQIPKRRLDEFPFPPDEGLVLVCRSAVGKVEEVAWRLGWGGG